MKRKAMYGIGALLCVVQMFFSLTFPCCAAQIGMGALPVEEERPRVTSVSISPGTAVVSKNATCAFAAAVTGENNYSKEVVWSVSGQTSGNTFIDGNGVLNVASDEAAASLVVKAVSKQDSNYSATALATIQASTYYIQLQASPDNGGSVFGSGAVKEGGYAVITAAPNNGFTFEGWLLNNNRVSQDARYVVDNIRSDATYVAEFKPVDCRVTINVNNADGGTATEGRTVRYGENIVLEAAPREGYEFDGWTENGNTVSRDRRMEVGNITGDRAFTAVFKKKEVKTYTITASASSTNGTVTPEGNTTVTEGSGVMYTITPDKGYTIRTVYVDGIEIGKTASFNFTNVRGDHTISADFEEAPKQDDPEKPEADQTKKEENKNETDKQDGTNKQDKKDAADNSDDPEKKLQEDGARKQEETDQKDAAMPEEEKSAGTLAALHISVEEAERLIAEKKEGELLAGALKTGDLQIAVHNDFADGRQENFGVYGLESAAGQLLSGEEELLMLQGELPVALDLSITDMEGKAPQEIKAAFEEKKLPGMTVGRHFEVTLEETKNNKTRSVSEISEEIKVVIHVPKPLQAEDRRFYVLRLHTMRDGSQELAQLVDEDEDPATITFSTDKFTPCAIAYMDWEPEEAVSSDHKPGKDSSMRNAAGIAIVVMAAIVTATGIWYIAGKKRK